MSKLLNKQGKLKRQPLLPASTTWSRLTPASFWRTPARSLHDNARAEFGHGSYRGSLPKGSYRQARKAELSSRYTVPQHYAM